VAPGMLVEGEWRVEERRGNEEGRFVRSGTTFRDFVTADDSSDFRAEAGRYHLYISWACPWAHRTAILRKLLISAQTPKPLILAALCNRE